LPLITVDTSVALPATLSPGGMTRKLWVVLAYGSLAYQAEHGRLELDALRAEAESAGGKLGGLDAAEHRVAAAEARSAALAERLPTGVPDDWVAIGSKVLFDEYERKVREKGTRFDPVLDARDASLLRRQLEAVCVAGSPPFDPRTVPALTRDPGDDPIVYGALVSDVDYLVSDDKDIVPEDEPHEYEHGDHRILAVRFRYLVSELMPEIEWAGIDGLLLTDAVAALARPKEL
jgi:predicted nucleic acid-binding protein